MKTFNEYLNEASLGRFYNHLNNPNNVIAVLTAYRNEKTKEENEKNNNFLKKFIKSAKFGFVRMEGGYVENTEGKEVDVTDEISFAIFTSKEREKELYNFVVSMGKKFEQDSILFVDKDKKAYWVSTREDSTVGPIGSKKILGDFHAKGLSGYFSKIGKKKFSFEVKENYEYSIEDVKSSQERRGQDIFCSLLRRAVRENCDVMELWAMPEK